MIYLSPDTNTSREYAIPGEFMTMPHPTKSSVIVNIPPPPPPPRHTPGYASPQNDTPTSQHYASTGKVELFIVDIFYNNDYFTAWSNHMVCVIFYMIYKKTN